MTTNSPTLQEQRIAEIKALGFEYVSGILGRHTVTLVKQTSLGRVYAYVSHTGARSTSIDGR